MNDTSDVWPPDVEAAFDEALLLYPAVGRHKNACPEEGKKYGRNELIARHILQVTGQSRTHKQVSSHLQVYAKKARNARNRAAAAAGVSLDDGAGNGHSNGSGAGGGAGSLMSTSSAALPVSRGNKRNHSAAVDGDGSGAAISSSTLGALMTASDLQSAGMVIDQNVLAAMQAPPSALTSLGGSSFLAMPPTSSAGFAALASTPLDLASLAAPPPAHEPPPQAVLQRPPLKGPAHSGGVVLSSSSRFAAPPGSASLASSLPPPSSSSSSATSSHAHPYTNGVVQAPAAVAAVALSRPPPSARGALPCSVTALSLTLVERPPPSAASLAADGETPIASPSAKRVARKRGRGGGGGGGGAHGGGDDDGATGTTLARLQLVLPDVRLPPQARELAGVSADVASLLWALCPMLHQVVVGGGLPRSSVLLLEAQLPPAPNVLSHSWSSLSSSAASTPSTASVPASPSPAPSPAPAALSTSSSAVAVPPDPSMQWVRPGEMDFDVQLVATRPPLLLRGGVPDTTTGGPIVPLFCHALALGLQPGTSVAPGVVTEAGLDALHSFHVSLPIGMAPGESDVVSLLLVSTSATGPAEPEAAQLALVVWLRAATTCVPTKAGWRLSRF